MSLRRLFMKPFRICFLFIVLLVPAFTSGQSVPAAVKRLAKNSLSCSDPGIHAERIGPAKRGYVATCSDTEIVIFEQNKSEFQKIFQSDMPMRAQWSFAKRASKGYYDFGWIVMANSGGYCAATYRWNGQRYSQITDKCYD